MGGGGSRRMPACPSCGVCDAWVCPCPDHYGKCVSDGKAPTKSDICCPDSAWGLSTHVSAATLLGSWRAHSWRDRTASA